jgi:hypothetical protein
MNARASEHYLTISRSSSASKSVANLFVAILADDKLLVISLVECKAKMGTEMKDSVKCIFL